MASGIHGAVPPTRSWSRAAQELSSLKRPIPDALDRLMVAVRNRIQDLRALGVVAGAWIS